MKKMCAFLILVLFLFGCAHAISQIEEKWGPPGKVEKLGDRTIYYYFQKGKASGLAVGGSSVAGMSGDYTAGWLVYEFTADETGKIIKERKYWKQPKLE